MLDREWKHSLRKASNFADGHTKDPSPEDSRVELDRRLAKNLESLQYLQFTYHELFLIHMNLLFPLICRRLKAQHPCE